MSLKLLLRTDLYNTVHRMINPGLQMVLLKARLVVAMFLIHDFIMGEAVSVAYVTETRVGLKRSVFFSEVSQVGFKFRTSCDP